MVRSFELQNAVENVALLSLASIFFASAPEGTFSLYLRSYWSEQAVLDGTWMPPQVEKVM